MRQLKTIATVRSVGASTRIEGSKMSDEEVEVLLKEMENTYSLLETEGLFTPILPTSLLQINKSAKWKLYLEKSRCASFPGWLFFHC